MVIIWVEHCGCRRECVRQAKAASICSAIRSTKRCLASQRGHTGAFTMNQSARSLSASLAACALGLIAAGQQQPAHQTGHVPATAPAQQPSDHPAGEPSMMDGPARDSPDDMLRGPEVPASAAHTLVRLDASGRFQRVEGRPEEAALVILELDPDLREQARQAAAARRETLRAAVLEHLDLIIAGTDAIEAGQREKATEIMRQMRDRIDPEHQRDPVLPALTAVLGSEQGQQLTLLVEDYWTACLDWELRNSKDKSDAARQRVTERIGFEMFQQEIRQAYERTLRPYRAKFEAIVNATQPTDEQKQAIRGILLDLIRAGGLEPTLDQQQETARKVYQALDEERRQKLFEAAFNRL